MHGLLEWPLGGSARAPKGRQPARACGRQMACGWQAASSGRANQWARCPQLQGPPGAVACADVLVGALREEWGGTRGWVGRGEGLSWHKQLPAIARACECIWREAGGRPRAGRAAHSFTRGWRRPHRHAAAAVFAEAGVTGGALGDRGGGGRGGAGGGGRLRCRGAAAALGAVLAAEALRQQAALRVGLGLGACMPEQGPGNAQGGCRSAAEWYCLSGGERRRALLASRRNGVGRPRALSRALAASRQALEAHRRPQGVTAAGARGAAWCCGGRRCFETCVWSRQGHGSLSKFG